MTRKFHSNPYRSYFAARQTDRQTNASCHISSLVEVKTIIAVVVVVVIILIVVIVWI